MDRNDGNLSFPVKTNPPFLQLMAVPSSEARTMALPINVVHGSSRHRRSNAAGHAQPHADVRGISSVILIRWYDLQTYLLTRRPGSIGQHRSDIAGGVSCEYCSVR